MNINLNLYKYFFEIASCMSYTKASEKLYISQPSLSYSIKVLEEQLGFKLFYKEKNKIYLTKNGTILYEQLGKIFDILNNIDLMSEKFSGKISVGVRSGFAYKIMPKLVNEFNNIYPNVVVDFYIAKSDELLNDLHIGKTNLIIEEYICEGFESETIIKSESIFIQDKDSCIDYIDLNEYSKRILAVENNLIHSNLKKKFQNIDFEFAASTPILIEKIKNSNYIGYVVKEIVFDELSNGIIKEVKCNNRLPETSMYLNYNEGNLSILERTFLNFIKEITFFRR